MGVPVVKNFKVGIALGSVAVALWLFFGLMPLKAQGPSGEALINRLNCLACHALAGRGGTRGPSWDGLGTRLTPGAIRQQLLTPKGRMPSYAHLKPEELEAVVQYLAGLK